MSLSEKTVAALAKFDTPTICDVIELFHLRPRHSGYVSSEIKPYFPMLSPMVGFAATSSTRASAPPLTADNCGSIEKQIELFETLPGPAVIVLQDLDTPSAAATFGGNMCAMYHAFGAAGLVSSGCGRDLEEIHALNFSVFARGAFCAHGYCHILTVGSPVLVGGVTISSKDLIHGDANGITTIPLEIAGEVPEVATEFQAAERKVTEFLRSPKAKTLAECAEIRREFFFIVDRLAERVRRD